MATPEHESYWQYLNRPVSETFFRPPSPRAASQQFLIWFLIAIVVGLAILSLKIAH